MTSEDLVYVYLLYFDDSFTRVYVGQTCNMYLRLQQHTYPSTLKLKSKRTGWIKSRLALGLELKMELIQTCTKSEANQKEIFWITEFSTAGFDVKNSTAGGEFFLGMKRSPQHCQKISEALKGRKPSPVTVEAAKKVNTGRKKTLEEKAHLSTFHKGKQKSQETKNKMSASQKGRTLSDHAKENISKSKSGQNHPLWGKKNSKETLRKRADSLGKIYHLISPQEENVEVFNLAKFSRDNQLDKRNLHSVVSGKQKSHRGWKLDYSQPQGYR